MAAQRERPQYGVNAGDQPKGKRGNERGESCTGEKKNDMMFKRNFHPPASHDDWGWVGKEQNQIEMKIFDIVKYRRTLAIIIDLPTPTTCQVFFEEHPKKFNVNFAEGHEIEPLQMPEDFNKADLCEAVKLFQVFSQKINLPTE
jgi:hypothetical protein